MSDDKRELSISPFWKMPNETNKAWVAFETYRDMPSLGMARLVNRLPEAIEFRRDLDSEVRKHYPKEVTRGQLNNMYLWSKKYKWDERIEEYTRTAEEEIRKKFYIDRIGKYEQISEAEGRIADSIYRLVMKSVIKLEQIDVNTLVVPESLEQYTTQISRLASAIKTMMDNVRASAYLNEALSHYDMVQQRIEEQLAERNSRNNVDVQVDDA